jgi:hypothetical protein
MTVLSDQQDPVDQQLKTQLSGIRKREMNHSLALCELAARVPNISAGHGMKQTGCPFDCVYRFDFYSRALILGVL